MPPRTRSNRQALTQTEHMRASGRPINSTGFAALPNEIYCEIALYIPGVSVSCHSVEEHQEITRKDASSDKALRPVFQRYLWQTIEVFDSFRLVDGRRLPAWHKRVLMGSDNVKLKLYAQELLRQLEVVTVRDPTLAQHVHNLNVLLPSYSSVAVYQELLRSIKLLPNLNTVRLSYPNRDGLDWKTILKNLPNDFPQIQHAYVDKCTIPFTSMCPNLTTLSFVSQVKALSPDDLRFSQASWDWQWISERVALSVTVLGVIPFHYRMYEALKRFRNLQDISLDCSLAKHFVSPSPPPRRNWNQKKCVYNLWEDFKQLRIIRFNAQHFYHDHTLHIIELPVPDAGIIAEWVGWAEDTLRRVQKHDKQTKMIYLTVQGGSRTVHLLEPGKDAQVLSVSALAPI
ncbi:hypothetical protein CVT24_011664 [Panaeolus cyanescens]|uniref:Uncharacterized protein n=1 Tax=Panaeolus cyanescens TaxID=181874 RepID=A0A409YH36_9AGAR|nr:hypothetical protein CVT24_011664 [Panaeolus cyanescens]